MKHLLRAFFLGLPLLALANAQAKQPQTNAPAHIFIDVQVQDPQVLQQAVNTDVENSHLFSHGKPGELLINGQWLQKEAIATFLNQTFFGEMSAGQRGLNIYACNFAQGELGREAVAYLEKELGIAVAASTNITGAGGDWVLEVGGKNLDINSYAYSLQCAGVVGGTGPGDDRDGDGYCNNVDLDDDNDGILDSEEVEIVSPLNAVTPTAAGAIVNYSTFSATYSLNVGSVNTLNLTNIYGTNVTTFSMTGGVSTVNEFEIVFSTPVVGLDIAALDLDAGEQFEYEFYDGSNNLIPDATGYISAIGSQIVTSTSSTSSGISLVWDTNPNIPVPNVASNDLTGAMRVTFPITGISVSRVIIRVTGADENYGIQFGILKAIAGDTDGDGIPDHLDLDSDNDDCPDALEGDENVDENATPAQLNPNGSINTAANGGVDAEGVPNLVNSGGIADIGSDQGQGIGNSRVATTATITTAPTNQIVPENAPATFTAAATATSTTAYTGTAPNTIPDYTVGTDASVGLNYQWYLGDPDLGGTLLQPDVIYSGTNTPTLNISNTGGLFNGDDFFVLVTHDDNPCIYEKQSASLLNACDPIASGNPDTDGDGLADLCDLDDDNDGILDEVECDPTFDFADNPLHPNFSLGKGQDLGFWDVIKLQPMVLGCIF